MVTYQPLPYITWGLFWDSQSNGIQKPKKDTKTNGQIDASVVESIIELHPVDLFTCSLMVKLYFCRTDIKQFCFRDLVIHHIQLVTILLGIEIKLHD